jgi:hypothetical protein
MYPVTITIHNDEQLKAVHAALTGVPGEPAKATGGRKAAAKDTAAPATSTAAAPAAQTPAPAQTPTAPAAPVLSEAGKKFINDKLAAPVKELSMKDEPKMKAICAEYGVERVSLIPEALFPEVLRKVQLALNPGLEEQERLEKIDNSRSLI